MINAKAARPRRKPLSAARRAELSAMPAHARFKAMGYVVVPDAVYTILPRKMPASWSMQFLVEYIMRRTWGDPQKPGWCRLSVRDLARITGKTAQAFAAALKDAVRLGIIVRRDSAECSAAFEYAVWPEEWSGLPDYDAADGETVPQAESSGAPESAGVTMDRFAAADDSSASAAADPGDQPVLVESGSSAPPVVLKVTLAGVQEPVPLRFETRNESGFPIACRTSTLANGTVRTTLFSRETSVQAQLYTFSGKSLQAQQIDPLKAYVLAASLRVFGSVPSAPLIAKVLKIARGLSVDEFARVSEQRLSRRRRDDTPALFEFIAGDAAKAHAERARLLRAESGALVADPPKPPGYDAAFRARIGEGSVNSFREVSGNAEATFDDMEAALARLRAEFGLGEVAAAGA